MRTEVTYCLTTQALDAGSCLSKTTTILHFSQPIMNCTLLSKKKAETDWPTNANRHF